MTERTIDTAINGNGQYEGKVYFFKSHHYLRYDLPSDKTDPGYPKPIAGNWLGWPTDFQQGIDAAVSWNTGKAYFFKGPHYLRFDWTSDKTDPGYPKPNAGNWPGWPTDFQQGIDAAVSWNTGKAYFFKGNKYIRVNMAPHPNNKVDSGYPKPIAGNWPGWPTDFQQGIDAAISLNTGKAYFFKGDKYIRVNMAPHPNNKVDPGYPKSIAGNWPGITESFGPNRMLGRLSEKYETGGRGPSTVSTGAGDLGGVSYGSYQMTSKPNGGTVSVFVSKADFPWLDDFSGLIPGTDAFTEKWKTIATQEREAFNNAEHMFIKRTHYDPLAAKVKNNHAIDVTKRHYALQEAIWSTAVQHGPNTKVIDRAMQSLTEQGKANPDQAKFDRFLISAIYAERGRRNADGKLTYFSNNSISVQEGVAKRFEHELEAALTMLTDGG